jgi:hypothetical protein
MVGYSSSTESDFCIYTFTPSPIFILYTLYSERHNNKTITESAAQIETTRSYMDLSFSRALKKNHDAMEQIGKPFVQRFKKHGVRSEIYHLTSNSSRSSTTSEQETVAAPEGLESIAKTLSIGDDVEIWVLLQFHRDQAHADEVHSNMMENESVGQLIKELDGLIAKSQALSRRF